MASIIWIIFIVIIVVRSLKTDDTDAGFFNRSGLSLYTDHKTGLQYVGSGYFGGTTPRLDENGNHMRVQK